MINIKEITYGEFGKCVRISDANIELVVTIDKGPFVIRYGFIGGESVLFEDAKAKYGQEVKDSPFRADRWNVYGGHRMWISPEKLPRTYYPDVYKVEYNVEATAVTFTAPEQEWTHMRYCLKVELLKNGEIRLTHTTQNTGAWDVKVAPWTITVMRGGGTVIIPQNTRDTGFFPNKWVAYWPYTSMGDERIKTGDKYITFTNKPSISAPAKIGVLNNAGYAIYVLKDCAFMKEFAFEDGAEYPDNGCNCESYMNGEYVEIESLSPLRVLESGKTMQHIETWQLSKIAKTETLNDNVIKAIAAKFGK
ncbi:MAG: hypothetical protein Q4C12_06810 [Clostridia bacterium]|nr:hypothetical protein [Clostridia bacterium]